jgi:hypothetical protein
MEIIIHNLKHGLMITIFVFVMMVFIDYLGVLTSGKFNTIVKGGLFRQYVIAAFLGATPGCLGAFMCVSFYIHGLISFGALTGAMIATAGDESYVMFAMIPKQAFIVHLVLFILGIIFAALVDKTIVFLKIKPCQECSIPNIHLEKECRCLNKIEIFGNLRDMSFVRFLLLFFVIISLFGFLSGSIGPEKWDWMRITFVVLLILTVFIVTTVPEHYLQKHIWNHIGKRHLWKIFLWTFSVLLITDIGLKFWNLDAFIKSHMPWVLLLAAIIGMIPESGPHLIFVTLFANGSIPFSVLLTSSIVQDGHGMLPLLSYTLRDSLLIKIFNLIIGLGLGLLLLSLGY